MKTKNKIKALTAISLLTSGTLFAQLASAQVSDPRKEISAQVQVTMEDLNTMETDAQNIVNAAKGNAANSSDFSNWLDTLPGKLTPALANFETAVRNNLIPPIQNGISQYNQSYDTIMSTQSAYSNSLLNQTFKEKMDGIDVNQLSQQYQEEIAKVFAAIFPFNFGNPTVDRHGRYVSVTWPNGKTQTIFADKEKQITSIIKGLSDVRFIQHTTGDLALSCGSDFWEEGEFHFKTVCELALNLKYFPGVSWEGLTRSEPNDPDQVAHTLAIAYLTNVYPFLLDGCVSKLCVLQKVQYIRTTISDLGRKLIKPLTFSTRDGRNITLNASSKIISGETILDDDLGKLTPAFFQFESLYSFLTQIDPTQFLNGLPLDVPTANKKN